MWLGKLPTRDVAIRRLRTRSQATARRSRERRAVSVDGAAHAAEGATTLWSLAQTPGSAARGVRCILAVEARSARRGMACGPPLKTQLSDRAPAAVAFGVLAVVLCVAVQAVSVSQEELTEVKRSTPDLDRGAQLFETCGACHGPDGGGTPDGQVPRIGGQHTSVLWKQLIDYRHDRRWDLRMEHFTDRHHLSDAQAIADVAAYIHQLEPNGPVGEGSGKLTTEGAALYAQLCRGCHGASAEGDAARAIPRIAGQHYEYLRRQFYDAVEGRRPNFSPAHIRLLARLDHDNIEAVADYLSRLPASTPQPQTSPGGGVH
jgi:cytochrome c553